MKKNLTSKTPISAEDAKATLLLAVEHQDKDLLWELISDYLGVQIPRVAICPDHCAPFDFVSDYIFGIIDFAIVLANRSGGKTENFAILDAVVSYLYPMTEIATVGAIQFQAKKCYDYFKEFAVRFPFVKNVRSLTMEHTDLLNKSKVQVLTGTMSGVNSPHPQLLFLDEIDLMTWQVLQQALSMPQAKNGVKSRTVVTSTRKFAGGVMQRMIDQAPQKGHKVYQWCIWEVMEALPKNDPELLAEIKKTFEGELPEKISEADGYYTWRDALNKRNSLDEETWEIEWLCRKPGLQGVIYGNAYSDDNNLLEGWSPEGKNGYLYIFEDFGYGEGHPDVVLPVYIPLEFDRLVIFDERYMTNYGTDQIWEATNEMLSEYGYSLPDPKQGIRGNVRGWVGDPHGLTELQDRRNKGAPIMEQAEDPKLYLVNNGIVLVRKLFQSGRLMITDKCVNLRLELMSYKRKKNLDGTYSQIPLKKNDHGPDALRYGIIKLFSQLSYKAFPINLPRKEGKTEGPRRFPDSTTIVRQSEFSRSGERGKPITAGFLKMKF